MIQILRANEQRLAEQCRRFRVQRLELFGSATRSDFDESRSDLDFVVTFADKTPGTYADRYLDFAEALEQLFGRKVDLLTERSIRNRHFRSEVEAAREIIYDQRNEEAAA
ncbi:nucleotidyltransferase family protein [soil metagenome]|jgi:predicted nucleotidyltransferase